VTGSTVRFAVRCTPRGGVDRIVGVTDGILQVRVAAPAVDGAANDALLRLLAAELGLPKSGLRIVTGATGRHKRIEAEGVEPSTLLARWPGLAV
jgi:uncharacterized protein YggU (UPF0235/DUF167 family)